MALLTNLSILLVLACFSHQLMLSSCQRSQGRRGRGAERGQDRNKGLKVGRQAKSAPPQPLKGKMVTRDKAECSWAATGEDVFTLGVSCKKGGGISSCEYEARPAACPRYASNVGLYWKQIARALRRRGDPCQGGRAPVRAGLCRGAPRDAHFRLRKAQRRPGPPSTPTPTPPPPPAPTAVKSCQSDHKKLAEEFCDDSWSTFCTFFFTMVQSEGC